jgi:two-component system, OmpR family, response regulator
MKLLVIDDNRALIRSLRDFLSKDFVIDAANSIRDGLRLATSTANDVIVLDISLPDGLGSDLCKQVRMAGITTPILVLTAVDNVQSRVDLLNNGADDYLIKPFSLAELRARLFALLRRAPAAYNTTRLTFGDLVMDVGKRQVKRQGHDIILRRKEFDILEYLLRNKGHAVTRTMIFNHVWESDKDRWHNTVDVHIKHLRDKVDRPFETPLIRTAYGIGYVIDDISSKK